MPEGGISFELWGLAGAVLVGIAVQFFKTQFVIEGKQAVLAAVIAGLVLSGVAHVPAFYQVITDGAAFLPLFMIVVETIGAGFLSGFAAGGGYDALKRS